VVAACNADVTFAKPLKTQNRIFDEASRAASGRNGKAFIFSLPANQPQNPLAPVLLYGLASSSSRKRSDMDCQLSNKSVLINLQPHRELLLSLGASIRLLTNIATGTKHSWRMLLD
jgi:hypothetical protein